MKKQTQKSEWLKYTHQEGRRFSFLIGFFVLIILLSGGCQKDSINGYLDGRWQILEIDKGEVVENVKNQQLYYNFYMHVCNLSGYGGVFTEANLQYEDNTIFLDFPYIHTPQEFEKLKRYGIYSNPVTFDVEHLSKDKLIIKEGDVVITLRKF